MFKASSGYEAGPYDYSAGNRETGNCSQVTFSHGATLSPRGFSQHVFGNETGFWGKGKQEFLQAKQPFTLLHSATGVVLHQILLLHRKPPLLSHCVADLGQAEVSKPLCAKFITQRHSRPAEQGVICPTVRCTQSQIPLLLDHSWCTKHIKTVSEETTIYSATTKSQQPDLHLLIYSL